MKGIFCISLDFEKYWGIHDVSDWQSKVNELLEVESVISQLLAHFERFHIHASWATVGLLMHDSWEEIQHKYAERIIPYHEKTYSPFPLNREKYKGIPDQIVTAQKEISAILSTSGQELASHTFSHYYTLEKGQSIADYKTDVESMKEICKSELSSIVFPRNQINNSYLDLQSEYGFSTFRGNQENNLWSNSPYASESILKKGKRFADAYYNISNTQSKSVQELAFVHGLLNIPANRFLRPSTGKALLEKRKLKRIKDEMTRAAENGHLYHLWWHPHNFARHQKEHFEQLLAILEHFTQLNKTFGMQSLNMKEIGELAK